MARQPSNASRHGGGEGADQKRGLTVILILAALTVIEYVFAVVLDAPGALVVVLGAIAVVKAWLIIMYFMHLPLVWQGEEA